MRILLTGSRDWSDSAAVWNELWAIHAAALEAGEEEITLVHGGCPTGADAIADGYARHLGWEVVVYHADWVSYGRRAGPLRNQDMVDRGADLCLAFIGNCSSPRCSIKELHPSHGASGCASMAEAAFIETKRITQ
jgi:hypothetical protein